MLDNRIIPRNPALVDLIASGYRFLAWLFLIVFVAPLLTIGVWRLLRPAPVPMETVP